MTAQNTPAEFTTTRGRRVALGQHYRDNRDANVRDLVVTKIGVYQPKPVAGVERPAVCSVTCSVTCSNESGVTSPPILVTKSADQLTGAEFVLVGETFRPVVTAELATGGVL